MAIVSPYRLRKAHIEQVYSGLLILIDKVELVTDISSPKEGYMIDLNAFQGPQYDEQPHKNSDGLYINTDVLVMELKKSLETTDTPVKGMDKGISTGLINEMITALAGSSKRQHERSSITGQEADVIIGLEQITTFFQGQSSHEDEFTLSDHDVEPDHVNINHHWDKKSTYGDWDSLSYDSIDEPKPEPVKLEEKKSNQLEQHRFDIDNESQSGVRLRCDSQQAENLVVGELLFILVRKQDSWNLGIVRWMSLANTKVDLGVLLLGSSVELVEASLSSDNTNEVKGFWIEQGQNGLSLLLPSKKFNQGDAITITRQNEELKIKLNDIAWKNEVFSQFKFDLIESESDIKHFD